MPRIHPEVFLPSILALLCGGCGDPSGAGKSASEPEVKMLRIIRNRCAVYAFGFGDSLGFRGCRPYLSPGKAFSLSDPRSLSTKDFIDLMGDWGAFDSLETFHAYQETLMVEDPGRDWSRAFTVESGPIIALEFTLDGDFSDRDSLTVSHLGRRSMLRRARDYFPAAAETFFRIPMTRVGNGTDDDRNGHVDDFAELDEGGVPVSELKGRRFARIEFEEPGSFPGPYPAGERRNISAFGQELVLE